MAIGAANTYLEPRHFEQLVGREGLDVDATSERDPLHISGVIGRKIDTSLA